MAIPCTPFLRRNPLNLRMHLDVKKRPEDRGRFESMLSV